MTFNQWVASTRASRFSSAFKASAEAIWNELTKAGKQEKEVARLLDDLMDGIERRYN